MRRRPQGFALLVVLFAVVLTMTAAALVVAAAAERMAILRQETRRLRLTGLLDAAQATALAELGAYPYWSGTAGEEIDGGTFAVAVGTWVDDRLSVELRAEYGGAVRTARAEIRIPPGERPQVTRWTPLP